MKIYNTIIVGAGAAGLYFAAHAGGPGHSILLLEKNKTTGTKLLMSGGGQCNLAHGGNIKEFLSCYGEKGPRIRTALYSHNNLAVCDFFERSGVNITEREDGKIFPASLDAHEVRDALLAAAKKNGVELRTGSNVAAIQALPSIHNPAADDAISADTISANAISADAISANAISADAISDDAISDVTSCDADTKGIPRYRISTMDGEFWDCCNLVIAAGGCSYPATGSDGSMFQVLQRNLDLKIVEPVPALTPAFVEKYPFTELSGISFQNVEVTIRNCTGSTETRSVTGDLLLTHRNLSGPVILNNSRYMKTGSRLAINFIFPYTIDSMTSQMKKEFNANPKTIENWTAEKYGLPKRFCEVVLREAGLSGRKVSTLSGGDMKTVAGQFSCMPFTVSGLGSFRQAMVTSGGVSLEEVSLKTMESKKYPGLYFIGEILDVDGDTGGYNLQFAFASAAAAARAVCG